MPLVTAPPFSATRNTASPQGQRLRRAASCDGVRPQTHDGVVTQSAGPASPYGTHRLRQVKKVGLRKTIDALDLALLPAHPQVLRPPVALLSMRPSIPKPSLTGARHPTDAPRLPTKRGNFEYLVTPVREEKIFFKGEHHTLLSSQSDGQRYLVGVPLFPKGHRSYVHVGRTVHGEVEFTSVWKVFRNEPHARTNAAGSITWHSNVRETLIRREVDIAQKLESKFAPIGVFQSREKIYVQYPVARGELSLYINLIHDHQQAFEPKERARTQKMLAEYLMLQLLPQVSAMHKRNVAHHDIKANNTFVDEWCNLHLADFGSALPLTLAPESGTWTNQRPEAFIEKNYDARADDLWALGKMGILALLGPDHDPFTLPYSHGPDVRTAKSHNAKVAADFLRKWTDIHGRYRQWAKQYKAFHEANRKLKRSDFLAPLPTLQPEPVGTQINQVFAKLTHVDRNLFWFNFMLVMFEPVTQNVHSADKINAWAKHEWGRHFTRYAPNNHKAEEQSTNFDFVLGLFARDTGVAYRQSLETNQLTNADLESMMQGMGRPQDPEGRQDRLRSITRIKRL